MLIKYLQNIIKHTILGLLIIVGGLFIYLVITILLGYMPSSKPFPSWYDASNGVLIDKIKLALDFIESLGYLIIGELLIVFVILSLLKLLFYNKIFYSVLSGLMIGLLTLVITYSLGYYASIDNNFIWISGLLGFLYGAVFSPKFIGQTNQ